MYALVFWVIRLVRLHLKLTTTSGYDQERTQKMEPRISYNYTISGDRPSALGGGILLPLAVTPGWSWTVVFSNGMRLFIPNPC